MNLWFQSTLATHEPSWTRQDETPPGVFHEKTRHCRGAIGGDALWKHHTGSHLCRLYSCASLSPGGGVSAAAVMTSSRAIFAVTSSRACGLASCCCCCWSASCVRSASLVKPASRDTHPSAVGTVGHFLTSLVAIFFFLSAGKRTVHSATRDCWCCCLSLKAAGHWCRFSQFPWKCWETCLKYARIERWNFFVGRAQCGGIQTWRRGEWCGFPGVWFARRRQVHRVVSPISAENTKHMTTWNPAGNCC